jgi:GNAT superfamily N-acetyltransferase
VEIRRARLEDAAAIAAVHVRTWQAAYEHVFGAARLAGIDTAAREGLARRFATDAEQDAFVAEQDDGRIVGFVACGPARMEEGADDERDEPRELFAIYVLPEAWGTRAASGLMQAAVEATRGRGSTGAFLWVLDDNPRARRFYEREGWYADGTAESEFLGLTVPLVRYRIVMNAALRPPNRGRPPRG